MVRYAGLHPVSSRRGSRHGRALAIGIGTLLIGLAAIAASAAISVRQVGNRVDLYVDDSRPVAEVVHELAARYGVVITYEDPRYAYEADLKDVTLEVRRDLDKYPPGQAPKVIVPMGGTLYLSYELPLRHDAVPRIEEILQKLATAQSATGTGGEFRVLHVGETYHVVPTRVRARNGAWVEQSSILDVPITIPKKLRSNDEMLDAICGAVSQAGGMTVSVGGGPVSRLVVRVERAVRGASAEPARDVLMRTLESTKQKAAWQLFYSPDDKIYFLNLYVLPDRAP